MPKINLKAESFITTDGMPVPFSTLNEEKRRDYTNNMLRNLGMAVSEYFSENPQEANTFFSRQKKN
ncbi:MAG: hypothetical protein E7497_03885 [Ruminococcus sp.]|nr:hypothetical protein [Ruminococcus sp.]